MPPANSGHNGYWEWGPPPETLGPVIVVGYDDAAALDRFLFDCQPADRIDNAAGVENEERGAPVWACAGARGLLEELWPRLRLLG